MLTKASVDKLWLALLDSVFPLRCICCGKTGALLCFSCERKLPYLLEQFCPVCGRASQGGFTHSLCLTHPSPERLFSAFRYHDPLRQVIFHWKYRDTKVLGEILGTLLVQMCERSLVYVPQDFSFIPVPLNRGRMMERGFNQSETLARALSQHFGCALMSDLVLRQKATPKQMGIKSESERKSNVAGAFSIGDDERVNNSNFVLVDDVWTTGATAMEIVRLLKNKGALQIWIFTLMRGR